MLQPLSWQDKPALIEHVFPVQKISAESFKEQMAGAGKTLTALGSYWKGRKPLILNKACILGALLPVSDDLLKDLEIFEMLMGMDNSTLAKRLGRIKPCDIAQRVTGLNTRDLFSIRLPVITKSRKWNYSTFEQLLPAKTPFDLKNYPVIAQFNDGTKKVLTPNLHWKDCVSEETKLEIESTALPFSNYNENVRNASRPEECGDELFSHSWAKVNAHLGTSAFSFPELVEQMGIARFGHRPRVADVFSGSGQIPFEAARLGCDVYASDLNPIACMLTWGGFNIVGASPEKRLEIDNAQKELAQKVQAEIDALGVETDGKGWHGKVYLYCLEVICPSSGWKVPVLPSLVISKEKKIVVELKPDTINKRYDITVHSDVTDEELEKSEIGTITRNSKFGEAYVTHTVMGVIHRNSISSIRGDYSSVTNGETKNSLRRWLLSDVNYKDDDILHERLYAIQWIKDNGSSRPDTEFRSVTDDDLKREAIVIEFVNQNILDWQSEGWVPDMRIEPGSPPRYEGRSLITTRGWTHWNHLFNARQLLIGSLVKRFARISNYLAFSQLLQYSNKLCRWDSGSGSGKAQSVFDNQALNTLYNYATRGSRYLNGFLDATYYSFPIDCNLSVNSHPAEALETENDIFITDPPYGDAVKYEEITEFFIAWLRKNPPAEFAHWTWDSRRSLAIKGEDEGFRQGMIAAYKKMAEKMPDNGIQVLMFTHQSGSIWADMTNIIWASGLQVTAAWYVVTETDSALRQGANVTGTIMLVLRKRHKELETFRDDLGWEIEEAVKVQVESLVGLDKSVRAHNSEGLYNDADLQMAGYAAALKVLTAYSTIDGKDMTVEAQAPRQRGRKTFVDEMIDFAVLTAVQFLVPVGFEKTEWQKMAKVERFYLKMAEMEHQGAKTLDNYSNFAKAFKVHHFEQLTSDTSKANAARLKLATEFKGSLMSGDAELANTPLRALLYGMYEIDKEVEVEDVLFHLMDNCPNYNQNKAILIKMADYLAEKREALKATKTFHPDREASAARILAESMRNQRL